MIWSCIEARLSHKLLERQNSFILSKLSRWHNGYWLVLELLMVMRVLSQTYIKLSSTSARCCPLWRRAHCVPRRSPVSGQRSLTATWRDVIMLRVCVLTAAWAEQFLSHVITDGRQPEAITNAQVTKVASSCADTKSAAEETSQTAKKVSALLIKIMFSPDTPLERDCHVWI